MFFVDAACHRLWAVTTLLPFITRALSGKQSIGMPIPFIVEPQKGSGETSADRFVVLLKSGKEKASCTLESLTREISSSRGMSLITLGSVRLGTGEKIVDLGGRIRFLFEMPTES